MRGIVAREAARGHSNIGASRVLSDPHTARYIAACVERKNFARTLYLSEGFTVIDASDPQSDTMVKGLGDGQPAGAGTQ